LIITATLGLKYMAKAVGLAHLSYPLSALVGSEPRTERLAATDAASAQVSDDPQPGEKQTATPSETAGL
jgi:hypothetical protein